MASDDAYRINSTLAQAIAPYAVEDRTLVITEAGIIPLRSGWTSIDAFGLNDKEIAHAGGITQERLALENPEMIIARGWSNTGKTAWASMIRELRVFVDVNGYVSANPWNPESELGREYGLYVRSDLPERDEIVEAIRSALIGLDAPN